MNFESEIFKRTKIIFSSLKKYGFVYKDGVYIYRKNIMNDSFSVEIMITEDDKVQGKIFDLEYQEEYINYRSELQRGEFVNKIREEFKNILTDIKEKCTIKKYFISDQANRIAKLIEEKYNDIPEFPWKTDQGSGIFRNPANNKWYGLIMDINKNKIDKGNEIVEIINIKLDEKEIEKLLKLKGFYKAYHMNKTHWITIILDDTLKDKEIMEYIEKSHKFTEFTKEWVIPANMKIYDVIKHFEHNKEIIWKQPTNIKINDIVFLYVGVPYSAILYKCVVTKINIPYKDNKINKVMQLSLKESFNKEKYNLDILKKYKLTSIRCPRYIPKELSDYINQ